MIGTLLFLAATSSTAAGDPGGPGPYAKKVIALEDQSHAPEFRGERPILYDLYCADLPSDEEDSVPTPARTLVALAHDRGGKKEHLAGLARHLAGFGFVVLVPNLPGPEPEQDLEAMRALLADVISSPARETALLWCVRQAQLDRLALVGHGSGAYAARRILSVDRYGSEELPIRPVAAVLLDPRSDPDLDRTRGGHPNWGPERNDPLVPHCLVLAADGPGSIAKELYDGPLSPLMRARATVPGANHCDAIDPGDPACQLGALAPDSERPRRLFRRATTAWLLAHAEHKSELGRHDDPALLELTDLAQRGGPDFGSSTIQLDASLILGVDIGADASRFQIGFRPEMILLRNSEASFGVGPYAEILAGGRTLAGGGFSLVVPLFSELILAPSVGADYDLGRSRGSIAAGGFVGYKKYNEVSFFDFSRGIRFDVRRELDGDRATTVLLSFQLDLATLVALGFAL
jgi:hypothetical protein